MCVAWFMKTRSSWIKQMKVYGQEVTNKASVEVVGLSSYPSYSNHGSSKQQRLFLMASHGFCGMITSSRHCLWRDHTITPLFVVWPRHHVNACDMMAWSRLQTVPFSSLSALSHRRCGGNALAGVLVTASNEPIKGNVNTSWRDCWTRRGRVCRQRRRDDVMY